jgi:rhodanese-related sulfurtransferase
MNEASNMSISVRRIAPAFILAATLWLNPSAHASDGDVAKVMEDYLELVDYMGGTILPRQIAREDWKDFYVIDARDAEQYQKEHIPGAVNIDWRQVLARRAELPKDKSILLYCNSGTLSAQGAFALKLAGVENVLILQGGLSQWKAEGGFDAQRRAAQPAKK